MDKLFSDIQQNFNQITQKNNKESLLTKQQISQDKINELLEKSSDAIMCGPTCQKSRISEELKQKYLDAETNIQTAPIKLEQSKKNYYIYTKGNSYYDNMKEEELKSKADTISKLLEDNFNNELLSANIMNSYLNTALTNSENTKELLKQYLIKNSLLKVKLKESRGDILTNDRKNYYENNALNSLQLWYTFFWYIYYVLVLIICLIFIFSSSNFKIITKIIFSIIIIFYPYYIIYINKFINYVFLSIQSKISKNVYNDL